MLPFLQFILVVFIIIVAAKVGGYLSVRLGQPAVVGEVLAGLILGPSVLNFLHWPVFSDEHLGETITLLAELGVLLLLFIAGLNLHLADLAKSGKTAVLAGSLGFILTLSLGYILAKIFSYETQQALFIGLILAPTSIGITAQTLMELKMLRSKVGTTLLGAAAIDDILGVLGVSLFLALIMGEVTSGLTGVLVILLRMIMYLAIASAIGFWLLPKLTQIIEKLPISQGLIAFTFVTVLLYAWSAEVVGHLAAIIGAFLAGIFLSRSSLMDKINEEFSPIAFGVFVPIFFVNVGLSANVRQISLEGLFLLAGMTVVVIVSKLIGAGMGGRFGGMTNRESLQLGVGMIPRGEVVLIVATVGITEGLIGAGVFSAVVVLVILTTLITPPILRGLFFWQKSNRR
ncbi:MAG: cation:proton antiporter [Anaerolineales bacterium]|nr:cation:proton antiporter [Anaerolineales bacterium]